MNSFFRGKMHRLPTVLLWLLTASLLTTACKKDDETTTDYTAVDDAAIKKYLADNSITTAQKQPSGLYFVPITTNATAPQANVKTAASINYTGRLLDGTMFDTSSKSGSRTSNFVVGNLVYISGLEEGTSLMHLGDSAVFLVPSRLAFGSNSNGAIPPNSILRFNVKLNDVASSLAIIDDKLIQNYLTVNKITNAQKQSSGLYFVPVITNTTATPSATGKTASVLYTGKLLDGTVFDASSKNGNTPFNFTVGAGKTILGFDQGISLMHKGDKATLLIPSGLAYGEQGANTIPPNAVLNFDVEVTDVK
ncbi:MAG: hypothetical protein EOO63_08870 [Hymenobacter sp.]|nr:MAG: hypothetical protein EOO63_08870 [Hymenobacter sp.]